MSNLDRIQDRILLVERPAFGHSFNWLKALLKLQFARPSRLKELEVERQKKMSNALLPEIMMKWRL